MINENLSDDIKTFYEKDTSQMFLKNAQLFIDLLDTKIIAKEIFFPKAHSVLIDLYSSGFKLESIELNYSEESDFEDNEVVDFNNTCLISELKQDAFYWEIFNPTDSEEDKECVQGWLVDDFAEIYRDLKIELNKINNICTN